MKIQPEFNIAAILSKISADDVMSSQVQRGNDHATPFENFFEAALQQIDDSQLAETIATLSQSGTVMPDSSERFVVPQVAGDSTMRALSGVATPTFRTLQLLNGRSVITSQVAFSMPVMAPDGLTSRAADLTVDAVPAVSPTPEGIVPVLAADSATTNVQASTERSAETWIGQTTRSQRADDIVLPGDTSRRFPSPAAQRIVPTQTPQVDPRMPVAVPAQALDADLLAPVDGDLAPDAVHATTVLPPGTLLSAADLKPAVLSGVSQPPAPDATAALVNAGKLDTHALQEASKPLADTPRFATTETSTRVSGELSRAVERRPSTEAWLKTMTRATSIPPLMESAPTPSFRVRPAVSDQIAQSPAVNATAARELATMRGVSVPPVASQPLTDTQRVSTTGTENLVSDDVSGAVERRPSTEARLNTMTKATPIPPLMNSVTTPTVMAPSAASDQIAQSPAVNATAARELAAMRGVSVPPVASQPVTDIQRVSTTRTETLVSDDVSGAVERRQSTEAWLKTMTRATPIPPQMPSAPTPPFMAQAPASSHPSAVPSPAIDSPAAPLTPAHSATGQTVAISNLPSMGAAPTVPTQVTDVSGNFPERWMHVDDLREQFGSVIKNTLLDRSVAGQTSLKIMLFPENMGSIEAEIIDNNRSITVNLVAQNDDVVRMLRDNSQGLRDAMGQSGTFELNIFRERGGHDGHASRDPSASNHDRGQAPGTGLDAAEGDAPLNEQHASVSGALDTYV